jgi:hypothetical protein
VPAVSFGFLDRRSAERFAELLDEPSGGRHHSRGGAVPASGGWPSGRRGESARTNDDELAELVAIGHSLCSARSGVRVDPDFRVGLRAMLVATAERDGIGQTATDADAEPVGGHDAVRESRRGLLGRAAGRRIRARGAIVIGVAAGAMAVSGISAASENAAPGDALYGVKRSTERAQLAMAGSDITRGQLSLDFARTRLAEAPALSDAAGFAGVLDDMDADTRQGVKLLTESAVTRTDTAPLTRVDGFVAAQKQAFAPLLDRLDGTKRERAEESLGLVEDVRHRVALLRAGLACTTVTRDGADALGPKLRNCTTDTDAGGTDEQTPGQGERQSSKKSSAENGEDATVAPERTAEPAQPAGDADPAATTPDDDVAPTRGGNRSPDLPAPAGSAPADRGSEENKGVIGGLLDGIFG